MSEYGCLKTLSLRWDCYGQMMSLRGELEKLILLASKKKKKLQVLSKTLRCILVVICILASLNIYSTNLVYLNMILLLSILLTHYLMTNSVLFVVRINDNIERAESELLEYCYNLYWLEKEVDELEYLIALNNRQILLTIPESYEKLIDWVFISLGWTCAFVTAVGAIAFLIYSIFSFMGYVFLYIHDVIISLKIFLF